MSSGPNPYLPSQRFFPEDQKLLQRELNNSYVDIAKSVNIREIGVYSESLTATGQTFEFLDTSRSQEAQRQVYNIGAINAGATLNTDHGLSGFTLFTRIYGVAQTTTNVWEPLPYASVTANANVELSVTMTQIVIKNGAAAPNISQVIVVLEFI